MIQDGNAGRDLIQVGRDYIRHINVNIASGNWLTVGVSLLPAIATVFVAGTGIKLTLEVVQEQVLPTIITKFSRDSVALTPQIDSLSTSENKSGSDSTNAFQAKSQIEETKIATNIKSLQETKKCRKCDLIGVNLSNADLVGADLREANLSGANLSGASLKDVKLSRANLERANLYNAELIGSNLSNAQLQRTNLSYANLSLANLKKAQLQEANLSNAILNLAKLSNANLWKANLGSAKLINTNLNNTDLRSTYLSFANFNNAKLIGSQLSDANIYSAKFSGTNLSSADLRGTQTNNEWFEKWKDINLCGAKMPDGTESRQGC